VSEGKCCAAPDVHHIAGIIGDKCLNCGAMTVLRRRPARSWQPKGKQRLSNGRERAMG
jgi:hypothetical protein